MKDINYLILEKLINNKNILIALIFWSEFCTPCKIMKNILKELNKNLKKKMKILEIETNCNEYTSEKFSIKSVPTIIIIKNKKIIIKKKGFIEKKYIKNLIKNF